jgi:hypothetical protein
VGEVQDVIATALGAEMATTTVEGRERFAVTVRNPHEMRSDPQQIGREVLVPVMDGGMIPLGQLARISIAKGTPGIRTENTLLSAYIYVDIRGRDIGGYVADAREAVTEQVKFPPGYYATWSGQFEAMERAIDKMKIVVPVTLLIIFLLLYLNFKRLTETLIVMLSVPFALVGGGDRRGDADLPRPCMGSVEKAAPRRRQGPDCGRPLRSGDGRRGGTRANEDDDRGRHHGRPVAHPVEYGNGIGSHEPHCGT